MCIIYLNRVSGLRLTESDLYLLASGGFDNNVKLWHLISDSGNVSTTRLQTQQRHSKQRGFLPKKPKESRRFALILVKK